MPVSSANFVQVQSVFGSAYVPRQHYDPLPLSRRSRKCLRPQFFTSQCS